MSSRSARVGGLGARTKRIVSTRYTRPAPAWTVRRPLVLVCRTRSRSTSLSSPRSEARRSAARTWRRRPVRKLTAPARDNGRTRIEIASTPDRASTGAVQPGSIWAGQRRPSAMSVKASGPSTTLGPTWYSEPSPASIDAAWPSSSSETGRSRIPCSSAVRRTSSATLATVVSLTPESTIKHRRGGRASFAARSRYRPAYAVRNLRGAPGTGESQSRCSDGLRSMGTDRIWNGPGIASYSSRVAAIAASRSSDRRRSRLTGGISNARRNSFCSAFCSGARRLMNMASSVPDWHLLSQWNLRTIVRTIRPRLGSALVMSRVSCVNALLWTTKVRPIRPNSRRTQEGVMTVQELQDACRLYGLMTGFDSTLARFRASVAPGFDPFVPEHRLYLLEWLNSWACRQFSIKDRPLASASLEAWAGEWIGRLPAPDRHLTDLTASEVRTCFEAYESLGAMPASRRALPTGKVSTVTYGPTGAAKTLFALRPLAIPPWDEPIRL